MNNDTPGIKEIRRNLQGAGFNDCLRYLRQAEDDFELLKAMTTQSRTDKEHKAR